MSFLLDTDMCSAHLKRPSGLAHRFAQHSGRLYLSSVTLAEIYVWAFRRKDRGKLLSAIDQDLLGNLTILDFDPQCARRFGELRGQLLDRGTVVNPIDLMIAATALCYDLTVVTHNVKHFNVVPNLRIADWLD